ncbi:serine/threonine receptor-like kinase NFP [Canna indica]|uniref:Serine/threonine receptor-like kinase NFP n=1 Tax=Canna indica TaxID=4628 RepID=A0AAQ3K1M8_9LILI|nr:serine/threonine receptor-like kinase NFP [Canna indica]
MRIACTESLLFLFLPSLLLLLQPNNAQLAAPLSDGIRCSSNRSIYPCQAYALYRVSATADLPALDLASVGDIFAVSRLAVARTSNLSFDATLRQGQPLLIPLTCSCSLNRSYAAVPYQINAGDTFYQVATDKLGNLTSYTAVELVNPTLVATNLTVGVVAIFPVFCQCLNSSSSPSVVSNGRRPLGLVTYVLQPSDTYASVAASFATDVQTLASINGPENSKSNYSTIFVPMYEIPPPLLLSNASSPPSAASPTIVRERKGVIAGLAVGLGLAGAFLLVLLSAWIWRWYLWKGGSKGASADGLMKKKMEGEFAGSASGDKLLSEISEWLDKYSVYKMEELKQATSDFAASSRVNGSVYRGMMDGEVFAIKKMKWNARDELKILQKVNHTNLVKLEGFCIDDEGGSCYLVYEYVENGSLDQWLHNPAAAHKLDWRNRLRIALDLANGLQYIHEHTWPRVVHKDIKSSNVLLDAHFRAKVANFGLARTGLNAVTTHIVGTQGYVAPEYVADGVVTTKTDVFAYGVVLLELVSGREAVGEGGEALWAEADKVFEKMTSSRGSGSGRATMIAWVDAALLTGSCPLESVATVMNLARECLRKDPARRPSMVEVAYNLSKADELFSDYSLESLSFDSPQGDREGR